MNFLNNHIENSKEFIYITNFPEQHKDLCRLEMKSLFNIEPNKKYFSSHIYISPCRSPFIKECLCAVYCEDTLEDILNKIMDEKICCNDFKVVYVKTDEDIEFKDRLNAMKRIGFAITGEPDMHNPKIIFGITKYNNKWYFGIYEKNSYEWHIHERKPYNYSNALGMRLAKAIVNIAVGNDLSLKVIDPCCGVGTVLIEAISMGVDIKGFELNDFIAQNCIKNLKFFNYSNVVTSGDMHTIEEVFDVGILDLPYGLFTPTTPEEQYNLIKTARKISKKTIIVTMEDMDDIIASCGYRIIEKCTIKKGQFTRYINVCI